MTKREMHGISSGKMSRGPIIIIAFIFGILAFTGYHYYQMRQSSAGYVIYLVYLMGGVSILLFLVAAKRRQ